MADLERLLSRAELCAERGQFKMSAQALDELDRRTPNEGDLPDELVDRYNLLCNTLDENGDYLSSEYKNEPVEQVKCIPCSGTGVYIYPDGRRRGICFACKGKGTQDSTDVTRNKNYWAFQRRRHLNYAKREAQPQAVAAGPFPFE